MGSNRTIVGLKLAANNIHHSNNQGSNRTIVGLKPILAAVASSLAFRQQSHHCGIETQQPLWLVSD